MKYKKWIIAILLACGVLYIFLYQPRPDLRGTWFVHRISINNKEYNGIQPGKYTSLMNVGYNDFSLRIMPGPRMRAKIGMPDRHTLIIKSENDTLLNGTYEMTVDTNNDSETMVHLKSKNKVFEFYKIESSQSPVMPKGLPRGRP